MANLAYKTVRGLMKALGRLPLGFHYAWAGFTAWLIGSVFHYRRDVVMTNIARSFPDKKYKELRAICKDFYRHFGEILAEAIWFAAATPERLHKSHVVEMENPEELNRLYSSSSSVLLLASHAGNWELFGGFYSYSYSQPLACNENDVCIVYKKLSSQVWDDVMKANRVAPVVDKEHFDGVVESQEVIRYMVRHRSERRIYCFITDQHPYKGSAGIDVGEFMHQPTTSMDGGAKLACKFGMSVAHLTMERVGRGHYRLRFVTLCEDASAVSPETIMRKYYEQLQKDLEAQPSNYLWTHKRWK